MLTRLVFVFVLTLIGSTGATFAAAEKNCLRVGYHQFPGMIAEDPLQGGLHGLAVDITQRWTEKTGRNVCHQEFPDFSKIFPDGVNSVDVMAGGFTMNDEREKLVDWSAPIMNAGTGIMVPTVEGSLSFLGILKALMNWVTAQAFLFLLLLIAVGGVILWFTERKDDRGIANDAKNGIRDAVYCVEDSVTTMGFGRAEPRTYVGRLLILLLFFVGSVPLSTITGQIASALTVVQLDNHISSPEELRGRKVATKAGTASVRLVEGVHAKVTLYATREEAVAELKKGTVDAVVYDAPYLRYVANEDATVMVSDVFASRHYGLALPSGSQLREELNQVILEMWNDGSMDRLIKHYFGE